MRRSATAALLASLLLAMPVLAAGKKKKEGKEEPTQALEPLKEPPNALAVETGKLVFRVTPLATQGLLSRQVRTGLEHLLNRDRSIVRLRAFVAGTGDLRRVQAIVSEVFEEKKLPLPVLTVVQAGALPAGGAQVVIESVSVDRKVVNPSGLAFISGQGASVSKPLEPMLPLVEQSITRLRTALSAVSLAPADVLRATCYVSSLDDVATIRVRVATEFPQAALNIVQRMREPAVSLSECEAVARLKQPAAQPLVFVNPPELANGSGQSQIALVSARRIAMTGGQLAFGYKEPDARLAFQRLGKSLEQAGASFKGVAVANAYPVSRPMADLVRKVRAEFCNGGQPPAGTILPFEGLPSMDASFAVDVIAALPESP